jgi:hypothetical protein
MVCDQVKSGTQNVGLGRGRADATNGAASSASSTKPVLPAGAIAALSVQKRHRLKRKAALRRPFDIELDV